MLIIRIYLILCTVCGYPLLAAAGSVTVELPATKGASVVSLHALATPHPPSVPTKYPVVLRQKGRKFAPHLMTIPVGTMVDMTNDDVVYHNVFSFSKAKPFDLGLYPHGDHKAVLFDHPGVVKIFCAVHPQMYAVILVMDTPWVKRADSVKSVRFSEVPAGRYRLQWWQNNRLLQHSSVVTVPATGSVRVKFAQRR